MNEIHESLNQMKIFLKIDGSYEDELISSLLFAADEFLLRSGVQKPIKRSHLYDLAVKMYVSEQYHNRHNRSKSPEKSRTGIESIILQLKSYKEGQ